MNKKDIIDLYDLMMEQLRDLYDGVKQKRSFLKKADKITNSEDLDELILSHKKQAKLQMERLEHVFNILQEKPSGEHCKGIKSLIKNSLELTHRCKIPEVKDASLITSIQHIDHYEVAGYGTSIAYAKVLGRHDVAEILLENLRENKDADTWLSDLAEKDINRSATWDALVAAVESTVS